MTEKKSKSILLSVLDNSDAYPFDRTFDVVFPIYAAKDVDAAYEVAKETQSKIALIIWGGQDISPTIYGQKPNKHTGAGTNLSSRDEIEVGCGKKAIDHGIPVIGICRGAQIMCCLSGGSLVQHVEGHAGGWHPIVTNTGWKYNCPSLHHQMMYPWHEGVEHDRIAWAPQPRSMTYEGEPVDDPTLGTGAYKLLDVPYEPEVLWFPQTKSLCIQSHPEYVADYEHPFVQYVLQLTNHYILGEPIGGSKPSTDNG